MPPQKTLNEKVDEYKRDLDTIADMLDLLKREYDLYFVGARKRQPYEMKSQIERLLRKWRGSNIQKLELQFRLTTLNSKYNSMVDVWEKILKRREIDPRALSPHGPTTAQLATEIAAVNREAERLKTGAPREERAATAAAAEAPRVSQPVDAEARARGIFDKFVDAKREMGESIGGLSFDKFRAQLDKQVDSIRGKTQCKDVEFSVIRKDGKVSLTAKPIRGDE